MDYTINNNSQIEERQQIQTSNKKALVLSCLLYLLLIILLLAVKRKEAPMAEVAGVEELEVNIGNVDEAFGNEQSLAPEMPSNTQPVEETPTQATIPTEQEDFVSEDHGEVTTSLKPKTSKPKKQIIQKKSTKNITAPVIRQEHSTPAEETTPVPTPKAVMGALNKNSTSSGGNQADSYKKGGDQGTGKSSGDMGMLGGAENGINAPVSFSIVKGLSNRNIIFLPQYSDDFSKEGTVRVRVTFDSRGNATTAAFYLPGSNTSDKTLINLAIKRAKAIKLNQDATAPIEQEAIFEFVFKIR